jgi:hypothetical protein
MAQKPKTGKRPPARTSGGIFSSMRGGMKNLVGTGKGKKQEKFTFWDVLFWIVAAILAAALVYRWVR